MLGINCLLNNTEIKGKLKDVMEYVGYSIADSGRKPSIEAVYRDLRNKGIEVDIQTVSHLYEDIFDTSDTDVFSSPEEVEAARAATFRRIIDKRVETVGRRELGKDNPVTAVAAQLSNLLLDDMTPQPTIQRVMQERLAKVAKRILNVDGKKTEAKSTEQLLQEVLNLESKNDYLIFGKMENAQHLFSELQKEFKELSEVAGDPYQEAQIQQYADMLENATYRMFLSTPEVKQIINDTLKEAGYTKEIKSAKGTKEVVDWNKVIQSNVDFRQTVNDVFAAKGFTPDNIKRVQDEMKEEYVGLMLEKANMMVNKRLEANSTEGSKSQKEVSVRDIINEVTGLQQVTASPAEALIKDKEVSTIIQQAFKDSGFVKEVNGKEIVDWKAMLREELDFKPYITTALTVQGVQPEQIQDVIEPLNEAYNSKIRGMLDKANDAATAERKVDRTEAMQKLLDLQYMGVFDSARQDALFKVLGVDSMDASEIRSLRKVMEQYNAVQKHPLAKFSPTVLKTFERQVENMIEGIEEKDKRINAIRKFGFYQQLGQAAILSNVRNITENTTSGFIEALLTAIQNPKAALEATKIFGRVYADIVQGGVREGAELSNSFNSSGNVGDRFNIETANTVGEKIAAGVTTLFKTTLDGADNAFKASMTYLHTMKVLSKELQRQGVPKDEANIIINEMYHGNRAEIEDVAKEMEKAITAAGVRTAKGKWKRIANEMSRANLLTDGEFFQSTMKRLEEEGRIQPNDVKLNEDVIKAITKAASATASKGLGHEADSKLLSYADAYNKSLGEKISQARTKGDKGELAKAEINRNLYAMLNKFRSGQLKWAMLSFQKSSGLALLQTLITDVAFNKGKYLNYDKLNLTDGEDPKQDAEEISRYMALRQRLVRETVAPVISYFVGTQVLLPMLMNAFTPGDDEDDETNKYQEFSQWMKKDPAVQSWMQKLLPELTFDYISSLTYQDQYGNIKLRGGTHPPNFLDILRPAIAKEGLKKNLSPHPVAQLLQDIKKQESKGDKGNAGIPAGKFLGAMLNLAAPLKAYDINKKALAVLSGEGGTSKEDWSKIAPKDMWEAFLYQTLNNDLYSKVISRPEPKEEE